MLTDQSTTSSTNSQLSYQLYRKCILATINGMLILEERRLPKQVGGGIVCRVDSHKLTLWRDGLYMVFRGSPDSSLSAYGAAREMLVADLYALYIGAKPNTPARPSKTCRHCGTPFYAVGNQQYCTHSCYMTSWQKRVKGKK